LILICFQ